MSTEANKALIREFFEQVWNQGSEEAIDRFIAENAGGNDPDFGMGREGFKKQWRKWRDAFPDLHFEIEEIIAEGDTVVARWTLTGTQTGPFLGIAPTGRKIRVSGMSMDHLRDGSPGLRVRWLGQPRTAPAAWRDPRGLERVSYQA